MSKRWFDKLLGRLFGSATHQEETSSEVTISVDHFYSLITAAPTFTGNPNYKLAVLASHFSQCRNSLGKIDTQKTPTVEEPYIIYSSFLAYIQQAQKNKSDTITFPVELLERFNADSIHMISFFSDKLDPNFLNKNTNLSRWVSNIVEGSTHLIPTKTPEYGALNKV